MVRSLPEMEETQVQSLSQKDPLEKGMPTQSSILACGSPWTEGMVDYSPWGCNKSDTLILQVIF